MLLNIFKFKTDLNEKTVTTIKNNGLGFTMGNNNGVINNYNFQITTAKSVEPFVSKIFNVAMSEKRKSIDIMGNDEKLNLKCSNELTQNYMQGITEEIKEHIETKKLRIKKPDLTCKSKWDFILNNKVISANIEDENFINYVLNGARFGINDEIVAEIKIEYYFDLTTTPQIKNYIIINVIEYPKQKL